MASVTVARCEPQHLAGVLDLYTRIFGAPARAAFERRYAWSRQRNLAPLETGEWVLLAEGARVVGYLGVLPTPYSVAGRQLWAHAGADYMVDPSVTFHGLSLMKESFKRFPRQVSVDDVAATKAVMGFFKARPVMKVARYAKPLDARVLRQHRDWAARLPPALLAPARPALRLIDRLRRPRGLARAVPVPFDSRFDDYARRLAAQGGATVHRDATYYRWRYGAGSPQASARALALLGPTGAIDGYTVVTTGTGELPAGYVLELDVATPASESQYLSLLVGALRELRAQGAYTAYVHVPEGSPAELQRALARLGFGERAYRTTLLARAAPGEEPEVAARLLDASRWNFQYGDAEVTHGTVT
jgi:hypothetical protein